MFYLVVSFYCTRIVRPGNKCRFFLRKTNFNSMKIVSIYIIEKYFKWNYIDIHFHICCAELSEPQNSHIIRKFLHKSEKLTFRKFSDFVQLSIFNLWQSPESTAQLTLAAVIWSNLKSEQTPSVMKYLTLWKLYTHICISFYINVCTCDTNTHTQI